MKEVATMNEAAIYLRINYCTLSRKVKNGEIPSFRIGGKVLFRMSSLSKWIDQQEEKKWESEIEQNCKIRRVKE